MTHLKLALLGPIQATLNGQPVAALTAGRLQALLAYLAVESGYEHRREALAALFWPDRSDQEALSALRYALSNLRRAIDDSKAHPPYLHITRHTIQFNRASDYWLDVNDFTFAGPEPAAPPSTIEQLAPLIALYRGEFLAGLTLSVGPAFEEWLLLNREQFHRRALTLLLHMIALYEGRGDYKPAAACARRYLSIEPWDEAGHRYLMRLLALSGQRNAAVAQFHLCRQMLADELGVTPEDDTIRLYENIRAGKLLANRPAETVPAPPPPTYLPPTPTLFVGREQELSRLRLCLGLALAGQGRVVFVAGEAGSGKTALLTEFTHQALSAHKNLLFAAGRGSAQAGTGDPYLPFREIFGLLTSDVEVCRAWGVDPPGLDQRLAAALPTVLTALVEAGPELLDTLIPVESLAKRVESLVPGEAAYRQWGAWLASRQEQAASTNRQDCLFEQISRVLQATARQQPLLLVLDDLQWADMNSISLLFHLGRQISSSRILIICAYRPADLALTEEQRHPIQPVVYEFQRKWGEILIDLDHAEGRSFVDAYLDSEPNHLTAEFRARLYQTAGGNPLFTVELVQHLQERGYLTRDITGRWIAGSTLDWQKIPARVEAIIAERIARLPAEWRAVLDVACVAGEEFEAELVAGVLDMDERAVLRVLSGPLSKQQRLIQSAGLSQTHAGQRLSRYRFRHGLFQHYLYHNLDEAERAGLHEAVGSRLEILHKEAAVELAPRLAWHFEAAGALERAADYYLVAGQHACHLSAYEEAIIHYRAGLALLERLPQPVNPAQRQTRLQRELALQLSLGRPLGVIRGWASPDQTHTYERAYELAHQLAGQNEMSSDFMLAFSAQITMATAQGEVRQALILSERLFALAQQNESPLGLGLAHWGLGVSHLFQGECVLGREHLEAAIALYYGPLAGLADAAVAEMGVTCLIWLTLALCFLGYPEQAMARGKEVITLARDSSTHLNQGMALAIAGCIPYICWNQPQPVRQYAIELLTLAQTKNLLLLREWVEIALGWCQVAAGEFEPGIARMERGTRAWQQMGTVMGHFWHLGLLAEAYGQAGQVEQGLACLEEGLALTRRVGHNQYEPELHRIKGELLRLKGETAGEAESYFRRAIELAHQQETRWWELQAVLSLARLEQSQGTAAQGQAQEMLINLAAWFKEGLDLPALREAQALIHNRLPEPAQN